MMTLEDMRAALGDRRIDIVASATGIHRATISRIRNDAKANPSYRVAKTLSDYLRGVSVDG